MCFSVWNVSFQNTSVWDPNVCFKIRKCVFSEKHICFLIKTHFKIIKRHISNYNKRHISNYSKDTFQNTYFQKTHFKIHIWYWLLLLGKFKSWNVSFDHYNVYFEKPYLFFCKRHICFSKSIFAFWIPIGNSQSGWWNVSFDHYNVSFEKPYLFFCKRHICFSKTIFVFWIPIGNSRSEWWNVFFEKNILCFEKNIFTIIEKAYLCF